MASAPSKKRNLTVWQSLKIVQQREEGATIKQMANGYVYQKEQYSDTERMCSKVIVIRNGKEICFMTT